MRAAVCREFGAPLVVEELELAAPGAGEVAVKVEACAICHSDVAFIDGAWGGELPLVFGHEIAGIVEAVGPGVAAVEPGQRVVVGLVRHCGECPRCRAGEPTLCTAIFPLDEASPLRTPGGGVVGQGLRCGGFAERTVVHASQAVPVADSLAPTSACLIACGVMTGMGAADHAAAIQPGQSVVVIGAGGVGLNAIQGAAIAGAGPLIAVDIARSKLDAALEFGATHAVDAAAGDALTQIQALTGEGADVVISTAPAAVEQGLAYLRRGGSLVVVGMPPTGKMAFFDPGLLAHEGKRIVGTKLGSARPQEYVPHLAGLYGDGRLKLDELVTATYPLDRINEAIDSMRAGQAVRNVIVF